MVNVAECSKWLIVKRGEKVVGMKLVAS